MNALKLFFALTESIYASLGQGLIIYLLARLIIFLLPWMNAAFRYKVLYLSLTVIFLLFIGRIGLLASAFANEPATLSGTLMEARRFIDSGFSFRSFVYQYAPWIGILYLGGIVVQSLGLLFSLAGVHFLRRRGGWQNDVVWQNRVEHLKEALQIRRKVMFLVGEKARSPFTFGWVKPVIFIPLAAINQLTPQQVEAILIHELAHIKRNDYLWNIVQKVMEIFLFFNPVAWVLGREIRKEREYCCDDMVVGSSQSAVSYAQALFLLERDRTSSLFLHATGGKTSRSLLDRIKRITDMETITSNGIPKVVALTGILAFILFLGWTRPTEATVTVTKMKSPTTQYKLFVHHDTTSGTGQAMPSSPAVPEVPESPVPSASPQTPVTASPSATPVAPVSPSLMITGTDTTILALPNAELNKYFSSPEWDQHMAEIRKAGEEMSRFFESPNWKQQIDRIQKQADGMKKMVNSPEWKARLAEITRNSERVKKMFDSPEWKERQRTLAQNMAEVNRKLGSQEWQNKMKDMQEKMMNLQKKLNSPEWKQKMEEAHKKSNGYEQENRAQ